MSTTLVGIILPSVEEFSISFGISCSHGSTDKRNYERVREHLISSNIDILIVELNYLNACYLFSVNRKNSTNVRYFCQLIPKSAIKKYIHNRFSNDFQLINKISKFMVEILLQIF